MPRVHKQKARKDYPKEGIKKGDAYYKWSIKTGPVSGISFRSKTPPKPSPLTLSPFLQEYYGIQEDLENLSADTAENLESQVQEIIGRIENLRDETQGSLDNMPEGLQQGDTGQLLQERIDGLENWQSDLEGVSLDFDFDEEEPEQEKGEPDDEFQTKIEEWQAKKEEAEAEFVQQAIEELQNTDAGL